MPQVKWDSNLIRPSNDWSSRDVKIPLNAWKVSVFGVCLVRILSHSDWMPKDTPYLSLFSPNAGKQEPEKLQILTLFTQGCKYQTLTKKTIYRNWVNGSFWVEELKKSNFSFDELTNTFDELTSINRKIPTTFKNANVTPYIRKAIAQIKQIFRPVSVFPLL